jgi:hypothetical protein
MPLPFAGIIQIRFLIKGLQFSREIRKIASQPFIGTPSSNVFVYLIFLLRYLVKYINVNGSILQLLSQKEEITRRERLYL